MPRLEASQVEAVLRRGSTARRAETAPGRFAAGDRVIARNIHPLAHTRLPRYARGRQGVVARDHGVFVFADTNALEQGEQPQHVYSVRFTARELWGPAAPATAVVHIDLWDAHLDPA